MQSISTDDLLAELRRRITSSAGITRQDIVYGVYAITLDHLAQLSTGNVCELGARCEEEADRRFDDEAEAHAAPVSN